jgi:cytochrome b
MVTPTPRRLVTDAPIRAFHLLFASGFAAAWLTGDAEGWRPLHVALGYGLAGLLTLRVVYGLVGPKPARLGAMARRALGLGPWLRALPAIGRGEAKARPGHWQQGATLLMAVLPLLLMLGLPFLALSGLATYQDWGGWGEATEELHEGLANALGLIALAHPLMVGALSLLRQRNLASPMWSGRVPGPGPDLVRHERRPWAILLVAAALAGTGAMWQAEAANPSGVVESADHRDGERGTREKGHEQEQEHDGDHDA